MIKILYGLAYTFLPIAKYVLTLYMIYYVWKGSEKIPRKAKKRIKKQKAYYNIVLEESYLQRKVYAEYEAKLIRRKLIKPDNLELVKSNLAFLGYKSSGEFLYKNIKPRIQFLVCPLVIFLTGFLTNTLWYLVVGEAVILFKLIMVGAVIFAIKILLDAFNIKKLVDDCVLQKLKAIEEDYPKLLNHLYYYYRQTAITYRFSDILKSFKAKVNPETEKIINILIQDCNKGELFAINAMIERLDKSPLMIELLTKIQKCIEHPNLGVSYIKSLKDVSDSKYKDERESREDIKTRRYANIAIFSSISILIIGVLVSTYLLSQVLK